MSVLLDSELIRATSFPLGVDLFPDQTAGCILRHGRSHSDRSSEISSSLVLFLGNIFLGNIGGGSWMKQASVLVSTCLLWGGLDTEVFDIVGEFCSLL